MGSIPGWFVRQEVTEHEITLPGLERQLDARRRRLQDEGKDGEAVREELERLRLQQTATVRLRPLSAGEVARINEIRVDAGGGTIPIGESRLLAVELALVGWSLPDAITRDTIRQLNPIVFQQIYDLVDVGEGDGDDDRPTPAPAPALLEPLEPGDEPIAEEVVRES